MRAIRYGVWHFLFWKYYFISRNPLCVQLDMEFGPTSSAVADPLSRNPLCVQLDMEIEVGNASSAAANNVAIRYACN